MALSSPFEMIQWTKKCMMRFLKEFSLFLTGAAINYLFMICYIEIGEIQMRWMCRYILRMNCE